MSVDREMSVAGHYGSADLKHRILDAIVASGLALDSLRPEQLGPVDEFHMGGRAATAEIVARAGLAPEDRVLDIGSGLGGLVRFLAHEVGCRAVGVDLTPEYVDIARELTALTGLADRASFFLGSALSLPFPDDSFDAALTFHVGMNIADRPKMYSEAARVLRPGGKLVIYDVLKGEVPGMRFPVPWAETAETSHLISADEVRSLLAQAGFTVREEEDRTPLVLKHHRERIAEASGGGTPSPLGLHLLQGANATEKSRNMIQMTEAGQIALGLFFAELNG